MYRNIWPCPPARPCPPPPAPAPAQPAADAEPAGPADLSTRGVDPELFPFRTWARLQKELLYSSPELLTHGDAQGGDVALRQALAGVSGRVPGRAVHDPEQVVVGAGLEYLLGLLAPLLPGRRWKIPATPRPAGAGKQRRALLLLPACGRGRPVHRGTDPVGRGGLLRHPKPPVPNGGHHARRTRGRNCSTGRHGVPDSGTSSRTTTILSSASIPAHCLALQGMAGADGPVIYLSTCSRSLAPSIRIAYMVLPVQLLPAAWRAAYRLYSSTVSRFEQQTLARFITGATLPGIWRGSGWPTRPGGTR